MKIEIVDHIDVNEAYAYLGSPEAGAVNLFIGTVRNHARDKGVVKLSFEAYEQMALKEMKKIGEQARQKWPLKKLVILHVTGDRPVGEPVVLTGVSAAHRQVSFEACRFLIDELKERVPIWKKEFYEDNSIWVNAHP